jgi:hypothetical protein
MDEQGRFAEPYRVVAGIAFALAGITATVLTVVFIVPDVGRLADAIQEAGAWERYRIQGHPEEGFPLASMSRVVVVAAVILAVGGVTLAIGRGGRWRLLLSGVAAGSAVYLLAFVQPWEARALPSWITPVLAIIPVLLGVVAVLLAMPALPQVRRAGRSVVAAALAVGAVVAAFDWARFQVIDRAFDSLGVPSLLVFVVAEPLLLSAIVVASMFVAGLDRIRGRRAYVRPGLVLLVAAVAAHIIGFYGVFAYIWSVWVPLNAGPLIGAMLGAIALVSFRDERTGHSSRRERPSSVRWDASSTGWD